MDARTTSFIIKHSGRPGSMEQYYGLGLFICCRDTGSGLGIYHETIVGLYEDYPDNHNSCGYGIKRCIPIFFYEKPPFRHSIYHLDGYWRCRCISTRHIDTRRASQHDAYYRGRIDSIGFGDNEAYVLA